MEGHYIYLILNKMERLLIPFFITTQLYYVEEQFYLIKLDFKYKIIVFLVIKLK